jgi:hypothetical protein
MYIDDLDRCPPARVVQVLEGGAPAAGNATVRRRGGGGREVAAPAPPHHYASLLTATSEASVTDTERVRWAATAMNYLETIFQIPFTLQPMSSSAYERLIDHLVPVAPEAHQTVEQPTAAGGVGSASAPTPEIGPTEEPTQSARLALNLAPESLVIEPVEQQFLKRLGGLIETPRAAKRLTNTYRLIRASLDADELDRFVEEGDHAVVSTLLGVMITQPELAARLFVQITEGQPQSFSELLEQVEAEEEGWKAPVTSLKSLSQGTTLPNPVSRWQPWVLPVARYSFHAGHVVESTP